VPGGLECLEITGMVVEARVSSGVVDRAGEIGTMPNIPPGVQYEWWSNLCTICLANGPRHKILHMPIPSIGLEPCFDRWRMEHGPDYWRTAFHLGWIVPFLGRP